MINQKNGVCNKLWWSTTDLDQRPSMSGIIVASIHRNIHFLSSLSNLDTIYPDAMCELMNIYRNSVRKIRL